MQAKHPYTEFFQSNQKMVGMVTMEMCINCEGHTTESTKYPALREPKEGLEKYSQHSQKVKLLQQSAMAQLTSSLSLLSFLDFILPSPRIIIILLL